MSAQSVTMHSGQLELLVGWGQSQFERLLQHNGHATRCYLL
jgi:hypothetical protein